MTYKGPGGFGRIVNIIMNVFMCAGFVGAFMSWLQLLPLMWVAGYVVQVIVMKSAMSFAKNATGFDPENPMPAGPPAGTPMQR